MFRNDPFLAQMKYILPAKKCVETKEKIINECYPMALYQLPSNISIYERTT